MGQRVSSCIHPRFTCSNSLYRNYGDYEKLKSEPDDSYHLQKHPQDYEKLQSQETDSFYIQIYDQEPHFPFELGKQLSGPLQLSNKSDNYVAFKVKTSNPLNYVVRPIYGVVLPRSIFDITVTMYAQKKAPPNMHCIDRFLIQSIVARPGATREDITSEMFEKKLGNEVKECKFRVVYDTPAQPPSIPSSRRI